MKNYLYLLFALLIMNGCSKGSDSTNPGNNNPPPISNPPGPGDIQITGADITYGSTDDPVQITGKNFGTDKSVLVVKFNNVVTPILMPNVAISGDNFTVKVPAKCGTGLITVTKGGKTAIGPSFFYIPSATLTTLYGKYNSPGDANGSGTSMRFAKIADFVFDKNNNIYVADDGHTSASNRGAIVRKISAAGTISTYSGGPLNGITSNDNVTWAAGLPSGSGGNSDVNGGGARFTYTTGIGISEDPNSNAFKLFVCDRTFIRIINEYTATGVYAGVIKDSVGGSDNPLVGGRHEAHLYPLNIGITVVPTPGDYGSPTLYFVDHGPRIVKIDANGNVSTLADLTATPGGYLTRMADGSFFLHSGGGPNKIYKISSAGIVSTWINTTDSLRNQATGLNESFGYQVHSGNPDCMAVDKNGHLFLMSSTSSIESFIEVFPDKSFIRRAAWPRSYPATDGFKGNVPYASKIIIKDNGDMYVSDLYSIRKLVYE